MRRVRGWHDPCKVSDEAKFRRIDMAYKIIASQCTGCSACEFECPNAAISMKGETFIIDPKKCTECEGSYDHPQCDTVCPVPKTCVPA
jgi:ferredoxin